MIKLAYISESLKYPIASITPELISTVSKQTGIAFSEVERLLFKLYPKGSIGSFMAGYYELAFKGTEKATEFEKATREIFERVFSFQAEHVGNKPLSPDILLVSEKCAFQAIVDNKAYSQYTISNDHRNRMIHNYIENPSHYSKHNEPMAFFLYIAGGFGNNIDLQIQNIHSQSGVPGAAISVSNFISLVEKYDPSFHSHESIKRLFTKNRQIKLEDIMEFV